MTSYETQRMAGEKGEEGRVVVVGVKLDGKSRELLTWSMVKVAYPGDCVIALHVLDNHEIVDRDGKSSLLTLVKTFDSVLAVYEGFCSLKQVDLKLKICRGSSIRKVLVWEAESYNASIVVVGTASKHHAIQSSTSMAKYIAKKLSKDCSVLAVHNGKIVYRREAAVSAVRIKELEGPTDHKQSSILNVFHRSVSSKSKQNMEDKAGCNEGIKEKLKRAMSKVDADCIGSAPNPNCTICSPNCFSSDNSRIQIREEPNGNDHKDTSLAIVPLKKLEVASSSVSLMVKGLPEHRPGWPLLRQVLMSGSQDLDPSLLRDVSVLQWAMQLPTRHIVPNANSSMKQSDCDQQEEDGSFDLDAQNGAIVPVGNEALSRHSSLDHDYISLPRELEGLHEKYSSTCRLFKYQELQSATSNFSPGNLIGKGGSSLVYQGSLPDGKALAVKILKPSKEVLKEFVLEIEIITSLHHKNVISLFGFCFEEDHLLLVYDLLPRGSLEENLHGSKKDLVAFGWNERYKVAAGVAEALHYLHSHDTQPIIHRDVKSSNILLSDDFEPQLSDFGLAKWALTSTHITCTDVVGTFGYLAPEYFMYGKVTDKIDVYAFGVVLLELLSGRKPISAEHPKGQESLVMWAKPILNGGKVSKLLDSGLPGNYDYDQIDRMVLAAILCIRRAPRARPQMSLVVKLLQGDVEVLKWARQQVDASENSDRLDGEAIPKPNLQSHLSLALLDVEDDSLSMNSIDEHISLEDYLCGRWSRSSSFD